MSDRPTISLDELRSALIPDAEGKPKRRSALSTDQVHEHAVATLAALRGLSKADKRRVLRRAEKILDA